MTNAYDAGAGGQIDIAAATTALRQGGEISSSSGKKDDPTVLASGNAGVININANQSVLVSGSGIYTNAFYSGDAGGLTVTSPLLTISDGGLVQSQNLDSGAGGNINLNVKQLDVTSRRQISVDTQSTKSGGNINIMNADTVKLAGSGIFATTALSIGNGGSINIGAKLFALNDKAAISADTSCLGMGGNIAVTATNSIDMRGGSSISAKSFFSGNGDAGAITIDAGSAMRMIDISLRTSTADAQGGNISIKARDLLYLQKAQIVSEAHMGAGSGGNITIDPILTVMNQSQIIANAFGGNGGNISISTSTFLKSPDSNIGAIISQDT